MTQRREFSHTVDTIETTRGPTANHPGDTYRTFGPGAPHWFIDGTEVTQAAWETEWANEFAIYGDVYAKDNP